MRKLLAMFKDIPAMVIDGSLYAIIAWFIFSQSYLGGDEAAKYVEPATKFWINYVIGSGGAVFGAIKMFRSTAYSEHQEEKKKTGNTEIITQ